MNKAKYTCENCNTTHEILEKDLKKKKTPFCKKCVQLMTRKGTKRPQQSGERNGSWKGGVHLTTDGYRATIVRGKFSETGRQIYKRDHIAVYESFLGRELKTKRGGMGEQIHHIDGDKLNNNIENLDLCSDAGDHVKLHNQLEEIAFELFRRGMIKYDKKTRKYSINE
jgi:hypothetical protein